MKIALDAMGGDFAPVETVKGAIEFCREYEAEVVLVGREELLKREIQKYPGYPVEKISIVNAEEVIEMGEHPAAAVKKKQNSSIVVANALVKNGEASAVVSAGNTGAAMAASLLYLGRIKGVSRPAIATVMPTLKKQMVLLDAGANTDCTSENILQFAIMGSAYARMKLGIKNPRVGLLSIGEEETKGNELVLASYPLLSASKLNFIGNVEGRDIHKGDVDVVVCDGFIGNVVLKLSEGLATTILTLIKNQLKTNIISLIGGLLVKPSLKGLISMLDAAEYGGMPLLGVKNVSIISHGSSKSKAIKNALRNAAGAVEENLIQTINASLYNHA